MHERATAPDIAPRPRAYMSQSPATPASRYTISREIASGGMATVYLGRLAGPGGFSRLVAIKRPHAHVARHPEFRAMLLDEGRLAASISHPNVVSTLDVVAEGHDLFLVMEYVPGSTLAQLQRIVRRRGERIPPAVACAIIHGVLLGLWAVHSARDDRGEPLDIVHRDVSPQNILVGQDGVARILDFGVAKAAGRLQITRDGQLKGKIAYMAPEQMQGNATPRTDLYATAIVLWEALTGQRLFTGEDDIEIFSKALTAPVDPPSKRVTGSEATGVRSWDELDAVVLRGLARNPADRFASAKEMASALDHCVRRATSAETSVWLERTTGDAAEPASAPVGDPVSNIVTVDEGGMGAPLETLTDPAHDAPAVKEPVSGATLRAATPAPAPIPVERGTTRRRSALVALAIFAVASTFAVVLWNQRAASHDAPATDPIAVVVAPAPAAASAIAQVQSSASSDAPQGIVPAPPPPVKGAPKSRTDRGRRASGASSPMTDVGHAIDERH